MGRPRLIILIRHAQSEGNKNREIHQVIPDHRVKLTDEGWRQAEDAGRRLRKLLRPDDTLQVFTSPYRRTRETTEGLLRTLTGGGGSGDDDEDDAGDAFDRAKIKVYEEPRLREQDFGNFQPCSAEMERMWQERADYGHFFYRIPDGESAADAYDRIAGFNESLWRQFGEADFPSVCVLVTHGLMTRVFLMKWYHWSVEYFEDLRNINHCEFVVMSRSQTTGKYDLESQLRTWSELRKQKAEERQRNPLRRNTLSSFLASPKNSPAMPPKQWGGCIGGCNHHHEQYPRRQQGSTLQDILLPDAVQHAHEGDALGDQPRVVAFGADGADTGPGSSKSLHSGRPLAAEHLLSGSGNSPGINTPHERSEDEADYFVPQPVVDPGKRAKNGPSKRPTLEEVARWTNESGMGQGKQANALGDEPEQDSVSPGEAVDGASDDITAAEQHDRSVRGSVY